MLGLEKKGIPLGENLDECDVATCNSFSLIKEWNLSDEANSHCCIETVAISAAPTGTSGASTCACVRCEERAWVLCCEIRAGRPVAGGPDIRARGLRAISVMRGDPCGMFDLRGRRGTDSP